MSEPALVTPAKLRELLLQPDDAAAMDSLGGSTEAAVLVPLYVDEGELHAVFTKRHEDMSRHAGEISFPGGRRDDSDGSLETTALREAEEEIGLARGDVEIVGALPPTGTFVTGFRIHPFVGVIRPGHVWKVEPREVQSVLELSLADLVSGFREQRLLRRGVPFKTPTYTVDDHLVWGATARIVGNLLGRLEPLLAS